MRHHHLTPIKNLKTARKKVSLISKVTHLVTSDVRNLFYHEIIRKTIIAFGTLFNSINIKHANDDGRTIDEIKVPLAYAPMQKFLAKIQQQARVKQGSRNYFT